jgi:hypothetical protein
VNEQHDKCECHECTQARWKMSQASGSLSSWSFRYWGQKPLDLIGKTVDVPAPSSPLPIPKQ